VLSSDSDSTLQFSGQVIDDAYLVTDDDTEDRTKDSDSAEKPEGFRVPVKSCTRFTVLGAVLLLVIGAMVTALILTNSRDAAHQSSTLRATRAPTASRHQSSMPSMSPSIFTVERFIDIHLPQYSKNDTAAFSLLETARASAVKWLNEESSYFLMMDLSQQKQRYSLAVFYMATTLQPWQNSTGWLSSDNECSWFSDSDEVCSDKMLYTTLQLNDNDLSGQLPEEIELLSELEVLDLRSNEIRGVLPSQLGTLSALQVMDVSNNQLTSTIPSSLGNLTSLQKLLIQSSNLTGPIPPTLFNAGTGLSFVDMSLNGLTGTIPSSIGHARNLSHLALGTNQLTGQLPTEIGLLTDLAVLSIASNHLTGYLPTEL
jgi:Leucine rich repeat